MMMKANFKNRTIFYATVLISLLFHVACAKAEDVTTGAKLKARVAEIGFERFQLWNHCFPVAVDLVTGLIKPFVSDLEKEEVEATIRSRLQNVQLYNPEPPVPSILSLALTVESESFEIDTTYMKTVIDLASGESAFVATWNLNWLPEEHEGNISNGVSLVRTKRHNKDKEYILYWVSKYVDKFIKEYMRVNSDACAH